MTATPETLARSEAYSQAEYTNLAVRYEAEIADVEARNGELPKLPQEQIDAAKTEAHAAETQAIAAKLQAEADAAKIDAQTKPTEKEAALATVAEKQAEIDSIARHKEELDFQKRLTDGTLTKEDEAIVAVRKEQQAQDVAKKMAWVERIKQSYLVGSGMSYT